MRVSGTINGRKPPLFDAQIVDEEGLWIDREGIGPVAIFPDGAVYIYEEADSDADPVIVRTPLNEADNA